MSDRTAFLGCAAAALLVVGGFLAAGPARAAALGPEALVGPVAVEALRGKLVLLAGASGQNGRIVLKDLTALGVRVRAMTRDAASARKDIGAGYDWIEADVTRPETLAAATSGVNIVISAVATAMPIGSNRPEKTDFEGTVNLARAAKAAGATRFVIITSSVSGQKDKFINYVMGDILIWKGRAEQSLMESGLEYVVVGPTAMNNDPGGVRPIRIFPREKYQRGMSITRADFAAVVIAAAALPAAANRTFSVANGTGPATADWSRTLGVMPRK